MQQSQMALQFRLKLAVVFLTQLCASVSFETYAQSDDAWIAKIVSIQGGIESKKKNETDWKPVALNSTYQLGDQIRIQEKSRAAILLSNDTIIRLDQNTTITFTRKTGEHQPYWLKIKKGIVHFLSRVPRTLKITTPFVDGTIEGTEFVVSVTDHTSINVFEGQVLAANDGGSLRLKKGQSAVAISRQQAPVLQKVIRPRDAVQWSLYYAPVLDYQISDFPDSGNTKWQAITRNSIRYYWKDDLSRAFSGIEQISEKISDPRFFNYRALLLLTVGRVDKARLDIEQALNLAPGNSDSNALLSIISAVQNDKEKALKFAQEAVDADPDSTGAHIALSYAQQAFFDIDNALKSVRTAVDLEPSNVLARARLAELWLSKGYLNKAVEEANKAVTLNPNRARAQSVLGFAYLTQIKTKKAKEAFEKAIKLDSADPLSRFGLGLAKIRASFEVFGIVSKSLKEGRSEIEIAALLDPNNSLIRSYLGKAYFDEKRDKLASEQFDLAHELDPKDPTPLFYNAIRKQTINRPVEALHDMQKSIELNNNREIYRSKFLLDEDLAARSASIARIYRDLGFQQRALFEGWRSLNVDPASYSAHRFLADSYSALPRHEIARVSELLQSQLLQPINITPVQPQLAESNLFILEGLGPADAAFNEFNPLFNRNRLALQSNGTIAEKDTQGDDIVQSGVLGRASYSMSQFHYETDGFRENNKLNTDIYDAFFQMSLSHKTSVQAEYRYFDEQRGDLSLRFDPDLFDLKRQLEQTDTLRLGFHHSFTPYSETIASFIYQNIDIATKQFTSIPVPIPVISSITVNDRNHLDENGWTGEIRHLYRSQSGRFYVTGGLGRFNSDRNNELNDTTTTTFTIPLPVNPLIEHTRKILDDDIRHTNFYIYSLIKSPEWITSAIGDITWTIGGSMDFFEGVGKEKTDLFNPKFGVTWNPIPGTTIRGAVFKTIKRQFISNQTIEPTQVAGFNQFFDDTNGTIAWRYGAAIDQKFAKSLYGGAEYSKRDLDVAFSIVGSTSVNFIRQGSDEDLLRTYLYWTPHDWLSLSAEYQYEWLKKEQPFLLGTEMFEKLRTHRVPLGITFFHPSGFSARLKGTYVNQDGRFADTPTRTKRVPGDDQFWIFDGSISYRLPKRHGIIRIGAKNLFNKNFNFQDTDPANPQIVPEQVIFARFTLSL